MHWFSATNHTAHTDRPEQPPTILGGCTRALLHSSTKPLTHKKTLGFQWKPRKDGGACGRLVETCPTVGAYSLGAPQYSGAHSSITS